MVTDEKYNGWTNRETWAFNLWLTSSESIYRIVRQWLGDTAVNSDDVLRLIASFQLLADGAPEYSDFWSMAEDIAADRKPEVGAITQYFANINAQETADALNEHFEPI